MTITNFHLRTLRAVSIGLVVAGSLFKLTHWPGAGALMISALVISILVLFLRAILGIRISGAEVARDLVMIGLLGSLMTRSLHLPGKWIAVGILLVGALAMIWFGRDHIFPSPGERSVMPTLFYSAIALVLLGTWFRIQHWQYSALLLIAGLSTGLAWILVSRKAEK